MAKYNGWIKTVLAASILAGMTGCATNGMKSAEVEHQTQAASSANLAEKSFMKVQQTPLISKAGTFWVEKTPLPQRVDPASQLPPVFSRHVEFNQQASLPLSELFVRLASLPTVAGLRYTVAQDVYEADPSKLGVNVGALNSGSAGNADSASKAGPQQPKTTGGSVGGSGDGSTKRVDVMVSDLIFKGTFVELLDTIATKTNLAWRYDGEKVNFFRYESRIFRIDALAGNLSTHSTISSTGTGSGGSGGGSGPSNSSSSNSSTSVDVKSDLMADVSSALQSQLSARGKMSLMPSTGQVTVTDTPEQLAKIERYIKDLNKALGKQIAFNVHVYAVQSNANDGYGVDWNAVWSTVATKYNLGFKTSGNTASMGNLFSVNLINAANGAPNDFNGSSAIVGALSTVGKTSLVTSTSVVTLNYIPVPVSVTTETGYLQEVSTTVSGTSGTSQTSLKPGSVVSGFNMNLLPQAGDSDDLTVQFSMDLSDLVKLSTFTSPDNKSSIQLPQKVLRNFLQRVSMRSGETLILSGFQQTKASDDKNGIGDPGFWAAGGSRNTTGSNTTLVIMITPYVMAK